MFILQIYNFPFIIRKKDRKAAKIVAQKQAFCAGSTLLALFVGWKQEKKDVA
jgi:hypothetical protein